MPKQCCSVLFPSCQVTTFPRTGDKTLPYFCRKFSFCLAPWGLASLRTGVCDKQWQVDQEPLRWVYEQAVICSIQGEKTETWKRTSQLGVWHRDSWCTPLTPISMGFAPMGTARWHFLNPLASRDHVISPGQWNVGKNDRCHFQAWLLKPPVRSSTPFFFIHLLVGCSEAAGELWSPRWHQSHKAEGAWVPEWCHGAECLTPRHTPTITGWWYDLKLNFVVLNCWEVELVWYSGYLPDYYRAEAEAETSGCSERGQGYPVPSQMFPIEVSRSVNKSNHISPGTGADDPTSLL